MKGRLPQGPGPGIGPPATAPGAGTNVGWSKAAISLLEDGVSGSRGTSATKTPSAVMPTTPSPTSSRRSAAGTKAHGSGADSCLLRGSSARKMARASWTSLPPVRPTCSTASAQSAQLTILTRASAHFAGPWEALGRASPISRRQRLAHGESTWRSAETGSRPLTGGTTAMAPAARCSRSRRCLRRSSTRSSCFRSSSSTGFPSASVTSSRAPRMSCWLSSTHSFSICLVFFTPL
mmetsp:Transcript_77541/g.250900  ORF Transcript_77541/g.250900 Transcript_77541/m.250900 type:complete len:235 (+) Transcript_77541:354-1058(+)